MKMNEVIDWINIVPNNSINTSINNEINNSSIASLTNDKSNANKISNLNAVACEKNDK